MRGRSGHVLGVLRGSLTETTLATSPPDSAQAAAYRETVGGGDEELLYGSIAEGTALMRRRPEVAIFDSIVSFFLDGDIAAMWDFREAHQVGGREERIFLAFVLFF